MVEQAIACTLTHGEMAKVKEEYRTSQHLYGAKARIEGNAAVVVLFGNKEPLGQFLRIMLAREEKCCAFLTFALAEMVDGFRLRLDSDAIDPEALRIFVEMLFPSVVWEV